jgi:phenylalanine-4-hydroxylase
VLRTRYRIDDFQQSYFVIDSFDHLLRETLNTDFAPLYAELEGLPDLEPEVVLATDNCISRGTQAYAAQRAAG